VCPPTSLLTYLCYLPSHLRSQPMICPPKLPILLPQPYLLIYYLPSLSTLLLKLPTYLLTNYLNYLLSYLGPQSTYIGIQHPTYLSHQLTYIGYISYLVISLELIWVPMGSRAFWKQILKTTLMDI